MRRAVGAMVVLLCLSACGSSGGVGTSAATSLVAGSTEPATPTCTSAAPTTLATSDTPVTATEAPTTTTTVLGDDLIAVNTGTFTFDVVCIRFGDCACDAAQAEPLTATISFGPEGVTFTSPGSDSNPDGSTITYAATGDGTYRRVDEAAESKVATIRFTDAGFVFTLTVDGAPCSEQTYTRR